MWGERFGLQHAGILCLKYRDSTSRVGDSGVLLRLELPVSRAREQEQRGWEQDVSTLPHRALMAVCASGGSWFGRWEPVSLC